MQRVQCVACAKVLCGRHRSSVEYVYCERCGRAKIRGLEARIEALRLSFHDAHALHALSSKRLHFLSFWNHGFHQNQHSHEQDFMPPLSDAALQPPDGPSVPAHRAILAGKSPAFNAIFCNPITQEQSKEESPHLVQVDDMPYPVLKAFVKFFYTAAIDSDVMEEHSVSLFHAANKYGVSLLKTLCEEWIIKNVNDQNALSNLKLAKQYGLDALKDAVLSTASSQIDKIPCYAEYSKFVEKEPALLLELYEGTVKKLSKKRKWNDAISGYQESTSARHCEDSSNDAQSTA